MYNCAKQIVLKNKPGVNAGKIAYADRIFSTNSRLRKILLRKNLAPNGFGVLDSI
jgi:hypothetical protein